MHLVDHARAWIEKTYKRPPMERMLRWTLARILPYPMRFRVALYFAKMGRPFAALMPDANTAKATKIRCSERMAPPVESTMLSHDGRPAGRIGASIRAGPRGT